MERHPGDFIIRWTFVGGTAWTVPGHFSVMSYVIRVEFVERDVVWAVVLGGVALGVCQYLVAFCGHGVSVRGTSSLAANTYISAKHDLAIVVIEVIYNRLHLGEAGRRSWFTRRCRRFGLHWCCCSCRHHRIILGLTHPSCSFHDDVWIFLMLLLLLGGGRFIKTFLRNFV